MDEGSRARSRSGGIDVPQMSGEGGWPLGLQPLHVMSRLVAAAAASNTSRELQLLHLLHYSRRNHHNAPGVGPAETSPFFLSTPSISSFSSSDLDTESTGSFFPERSTTLGSLIGINHPRPAGRMARRLHGRRWAATAERQPLSCQPKHHLSTTQRLQACCCAAFTLLLRCASSHCRSHANAHDAISPSLAHLLELERKAAHFQEPGRAVLSCESSDHDITLEDGERSHDLSNLNTLFNNDGILPPRPFGAPLGVEATDSSYISADWSASVPVERRTKDCHGTTNTSLCPGFWKMS